MKSTDNKTKFYLTIGTIVTIIIVAWFLNLKNIIQPNNSEKTDQNSELNQNWQQLTKDFNTAIDSFQEIKESLTQAPTSSTIELQNATSITPNQLETVIKNLNLASSTTSTVESQL